MINKEFIQSFYLFINYNINLTIFKLFWLNFYNIIVVKKIPLKKNILLKINCTALVLFAMHR